MAGRRQDVAGVKLLLLLDGVDVNLLLLLKLRYRAIVSKLGTDCAVIVNDWINSRAVEIEIGAERGLTLGTTDLRARGRDGEQECKKRGQTSKPAVGSAHDALLAQRAIAQLA